MSNLKIKYIGKISPPFSSNDLLSIIQSQIPSSLSNTSIFQLGIYYNNTNYNLVEPVIRFSINNKDISLGSLTNTLELNDVYITQFSLSQFSRNQINNSPEDLYIVYGLT